MIKPTVHLNGTSAETLLEGYRNAMRKLREAATAMQQIAPNARDYYPQGDAAYGQADREHQTRIMPLYKAMEDLNALAVHVQKSRRNGQDAVSQGVKLLDEIDEATGQSRR